MSTLKDIIPYGLTHQPIIGVDYKGIDEKAGYGDAEFLSLGKATWDKADISAKVFRKNSGKWSRQSEELPLWRVLDLAQLVVARILNLQSPMDEEIVDSNNLTQLDDFIEENMNLYAPRIKSLASLLIRANCLCASDSSTPSVFDFATSELSQDAILCYIFKWADDKYLTKDSQLCKIGKQILSLFSKIPSDEIHKVNVGRQWKNIDIWIEINEDSFLIVEDKTSTSIHDNQLERYKSIVLEEYNGIREKLIFTYFKTENEPKSILSKIEELDYQIITRTSLLNILKKYNGNNTIILEYTLYLQGIEDMTNEYKTLPVEKWGWYQWQGFFKELECHIDVESWSYVSNPNGGFLGLWWHFVENSEDSVRMYLQFEESKLCFKIEFYGDKDMRSNIRDKYHEKLMELAQKNGISINRPSRFGAGTYMTIGIVPTNEIFGPGVLDIFKLSKKLREYEELINNCI